MTADATIDDTEYRTSLGAMGRPRESAIDQINRIIDLGSHSSHAGHGFFGCGQGQKCRLAISD